jgi:hypothetical protein
MNFWRCLFIIIVTLLAAIGAWVLFITISNAYVKI